VDQMKALDAQLKELLAASEGPKFDREGMETVLLRRMIVVPSFEIHGGTSGFFDFGPVGCALKDNIINTWKKHFVLQEKMLQVEATCMTAEAVLKASGHVDRFTDLMVKDESSGLCYRADKLLEDHIENLLRANPTMPKAEREELELIFRQADAFSPEELGQLISERFQIKAPDTGEPLSQPFPFNLMFKSMIGPEGTNVGFLRPETAQGIFVNFKRLLDYNSGKLPFAAAQVGLGFRNEINPRNGLIRVREFCMAEIEHFVHPEEKEHPKFSQVQDVVLTLFPSTNQLETGKVVEMTVGDAVAQKVINNETLAYFMARTHLFLQKIGIDMERVRFRQHLPTEMAHYSSDCWDAEIKLSYGWTECVGHADRAAYDLRVHSEATNVDLTAVRYLNPPRDVEYAKVEPNKKVLGKAFKKEAAVVIKAVEDMPVDDAVKIGEALAAGENVDLPHGDQTFTLTPEMLKISRDRKTVHVENYYPNVIEPSFGIGRILHAVLEHTFYLRGAEEDEDKKVEKGAVDRTVFRFNPLVAPVKCGVCPVRKVPAQEEKALEIADELVETGLYSQTDVSSTAIGKKYARFDEIGIPFVITVDPQTLEDGSITLRERDSQEQIRVPDVNSVLKLAQQLCTGLTKWSEVVEQYGLFVSSS